MGISEKLTTIAENIPKVYKAGQSSMVDESKIIEKTVSGESVILDDVSEIPHDVTVTLTSGNGKNLWNRGNQTFVQMSGGFSVNLSAGVTYTFSALVTSSDTDHDDCLVYDATNNVLLGYIKRDVRSSMTFTSQNTISRLYLYASRTRASGEGDTATFEDIMIEEGDIATDYEPYKETLTDYSGVTVFIGRSENAITETLKANADGTVEGIKSTSPYMYMATDNLNCTINVEYHKSYGMQTEYDKFWDAFQDFGKRVTYSYAFDYYGWNNATLKPKYDIVPQYGGATGMFRYMEFEGDLDKHLKTLGVKLDFSKITGVSQLFYYSEKITVLPEIDFSSIGNNTCNYVFANCTKLKTIKKLILTENTNFSADNFTACYALENIKIGGTIGVSMNFQWSTKLTKESILSIFNALSATKNGLTLTLSKTAVTNAFGSTTATEWTNLIATKTNWTISLI